MIKTLIARHGLPNNSPNEKIVLDICTRGDGVSLFDGKYFALIIGASVPQLTSQKIHPLVVVDLNGADENRDVCRF